MLVGMMNAVKPRDRILNVADELFYARGIHAVGVDEIVARSGTAKTTLYAHFPSKDHLIAAYLKRRSEAWRVYVEEQLAIHPGSARERIDLVFTLLANGCVDPGFRGCPFINAAAEFPNPTHPARIVGDAHRAWVRQTFLELAQAGDAADSGALADWLALLYDAAMVGSHLDKSGQSAVRSREAALILVDSALPAAATTQLDTAGSRAVNH